MSPSIIIRRFFAKRPVSASSPEAHWPSLYFVILALSLFIWLNIGGGRKVVVAMFSSYRLQKSLIATGVAIFLLAVFDTFVPTISALIDRLHTLLP